MKKTKHGKVEARKPKPLLQFKLGFMLFLLLLGFALSFALYLKQATSDPNYWNDEIIANSSTDTNDEDSPSADHSSVINPVPLSDTMNEMSLTDCAFLGEMTELSSYYDTVSELTFSDTVSNLDSTRCKTIVARLTKAQPSAVYLQFAYEESMAEQIDSVQAFAESLLSYGGKIYFLSTLPTDDATQCEQITLFNSELLALADSLGVHYIDIATSLKSNDGTLSEEYASVSARATAVLQAILTHVA